MNVHQVMQYYQKTLDYFKPAVIDYFLSQSYEYSDRKNINHLFYAFIEMCQYPELFIAMMEKKPPEDVVEKIIESHSREWAKIVKYICEPK